MQKELSITLINIETLKQEYSLRDHGESRRYS